MRDDRARYDTGHVRSGGDRPAPRRPYHHRHRVERPSDRRPGLPRRAVPGDPAPAPAGPDDDLDQPFADTTGVGGRTRYGRRRPGTYRHRADPSPSRPRPSDRDDRRYPPPDHTLPRRPTEPTHRQPVPHPSAAPTHPPRT